MSLASVHPPKLHTSLSSSSLTTLSHSLDDLVSTTWTNQLNSDAVSTIEELRDQLNCCFTCGVSWADDHVSLDCAECGGYALERPCSDCDGLCGSVWKRDLTLTHATGKARWNGKCARASSAASKKIDVSEELSISLEKLSAKNS